MSLATRRKKLFLANPYCHYCGILTIWCDTEYVGNQTKEMPDNAATVEHLYSELSGLKRPKRGPATVLACRKCNRHKSAVDMIKLPLDKKIELNGPNFLRRYLLKFCNEINKLE